MNPVERQLDLLVACAASKKLLVLFIALVRLTLSYKVDVLKQAAFSQGNYRRGNNCIQCQ